MEKYYGGSSLEQIQDYFPRFSEKKVKQLAELYEKCVDAFGIDGSIYEIKTNSKTYVGIVRNMNWVNFGVEPVFMEVELRSPKENHANRFYQDHERRVKISFMDVREIKLIKKGNERLSESEHEFVCESVKKGMKGDEIEKILTDNPHS